MSEGRKTTTAEIANIINRKRAMPYLIEVQEPGSNFRPAGFIDGYEAAARYVNAKNQAGMSRGAFYRAVPIRELEEAK